VAAGGPRRAADPLGGDGAGAVNRISVHADHTDEERVAMKAAVQRVSEDGSLVSSLAVRQRPNVVTVEGDKIGDMTAAPAQLQTSHNRFRTA
jgi:hypothetical protein